MPLYEYECDKCRTYQTGMRRIEERETENPWCFRCQQRMKLIISAVTGFVKNPAAGHTRRG